MNTTAAPSARHPVEELAEDFLTRLRRGERPSLTDYVQQYPDVANELADIIQALLVLEGLRVDEEDFEDSGPPLPERLGEYRLVREIGRGGMGIVYEAEQVELGRHVALKVLPTVALLRPTHLERFRRESRAAARLHHNNIIPVYGVGVQDGIHYYAMQYIAGRGLEAILRDLRKQRTDPSAETGKSAATMLSGTSATGSTEYHRAVSRVVLQVAEALTHAHSHGVLHRDVKPANVILDNQGTAWLGDFGLAYLEGDSPLTGTGSFVGTLLYLAPERFKGDGDARSDVYSLGATLYELLTLRPMFDATDRTQLIRQVTQDEPPTPRRIDPAISRDLETLVLKAIAKNPDDRYETCAAMAEDLRRFIADRPLTARRISRSELFRRWVRRNPVVFASLTAVLLSLFLGTLISTWQAIRATNAENYAEKGWAGEKVERDRAVEKERIAKQRLFEARLAQVRASRRSGVVGQRVESLAAIAEAVGLAKELDLNQSAWTVLRHEAIACLGLTDLHLLKEWQGWSPEFGDWPAFDGELQLSTRSDFQGIVSIEPLGGERELAKVGDPGPESYQRVTFSPRGDLLALASKSLAVWDWQRQSVVWRCPHKDFLADTVVFHPNNGQIAVGRADGTISIIDVHSKQEIQQFKLEARPTRLAFSPDGKKLAVACYSDNHVQIRQLKTGELLRQWDEPAGPFGVAWHPDGQLLVVWTNDFNMHLRNAETGVAQAVLIGHQQPVVHAGFSSAGDRLWSWSWDGTTRLWDTWSGKELVRAPGINAHVSNDGRRLICRRGNQLLLWDLAGGEEYRSLPGWEVVSPVDEHRNQSARLSPDGRLLVIAGTKGVRLVEPNSGRSLAVLPTGLGGACFHPSGRELFTFDNDIYRWPLHFSDPRQDSNELGAVWRLGPPQRIGQRATAIALDHSGSRMIVGTMRATAAVFDLDKPDAPRHLKHGAAIYVDLSPDGRWAATGTHNGAGAKVWDAASGELVRDLLTDRISTAVAFRPDGEQLVTGNHKEIVFWQTGTWQELRRIPMNGESHPAIAWDSGSRLMAYTPSRYHVELQDPATGTTLASLEAPDGLQVVAMIFDPDGDRLIVWSLRPSHIRVWDLRLLRSRLAQMGLDWDAPPYEPHAPKLETPIRIEVDLGEFAEKNKP